MHKVPTEVPIPLTTPSHTLTRYSSALARELLAVAAGQTACLRTKSHSALETQEAMLLQLHVQQLLLLLLQPVGNRVSYHPGS